MTKPPICAFVRWRTALRVTACTIGCTHGLRTKSNRDDARLFGRLGRETEEAPRRAAEEIETEGEGHNTTGTAITVRATSDASRFP